MLFSFFKFLFPVKLLNWTNGFCSTNAVEILLMNEERVEEKNDSFII